MFKFAHNNLNVLDLERSLKFYAEALKLKEIRRTEAEEFTLVYLGDECGSAHELELLWRKNRVEPYALGDNKFHLAFKTDDFAAAHAKHAAMNCICQENLARGIYFIADPDGYWLEILS